MRNKLSFALIILFMATLLILFTTRFDNDGWFLLNSGRYVESYGVPHTEPFTIHEDFHFVMQQWLFAFLLWKLYTLTGITGMMMYSWCIGGILLFVFYKLVRIIDKRSKKINLAITVTIGSLFIFAFVCQRPQTISGLIFLLELYFLERFRNYQRPPLYIYPLFLLLSVLLVNMHAAMWPMIIIFLLPYIAEELVGKRLPSFPISFMWKKKFLLLLLFTAILGGILNPYGMEAMLYGIHSYGYKEINSMVGEMHPMFITFNGYVRIIMCLMFFTIIACTQAIITRKNIALHYIFLSLGTGLMALMAYRSIFLFLLFGTLPLVKILQDIASPLKDKSDNSPAPQHIMKMMLLLSVGTAIVLYILFTRHPIPEGRSYLIIFSIVLPLILAVLSIYLIIKDRKVSGIWRQDVRRTYIALILTILFPLCAIDLNFNNTMVPPALKKSVQILLQNNDKDQISLWTGYNEGSYVEYQGIRCYLDARAETFIPQLNHKKDVFLEYVSLQNGSLDYHDFLKRYHFTHLLTTNNDLLYTYLKDDSNYKLIWDSEEDEEIIKNQKEDDIKVRLYECIPNNS